MTENETRANRALLALKAYMKLTIYTWKSEIDESDFVDLLTDMMHLASTMGVNMDDVVRCAKSNFEAETV